MKGKIYAFGASARSSTLLNFCEISNKTIANIFDNNPLKQNLLADAYMTLKNNTKIHYYMSDFYKPSKEQHIRFNDKFFSIKWPQKPSVISKKDLNISNFRLNK